MCVETFKFENIWSQIKKNNMSNFDPFQVYENLNKFINLAG